MEFIISLLILFPWSIVIIYSIKLGRRHFKWLKDIKQYEHCVLQSSPECIEAMNIRHKYKSDKRFEKCSEYIHRMYKIKSNIGNIVEGK